MRGNVAPILFLQVWAYRWTRSPTAIASARHALALAAAGDFSGLEVLYVQ